MMKTTYVACVIAATMLASCRASVTEENAEQVDAAPESTVVLDEEIESPVVEGPNYEQDFNDFVKSVQNQDSLALLKYFPSQAMFEDSYWHMQKDIYKETIATLTYADLVDSHIGGDEVVTEVKDLNINLTTDPDEVFYLLLNFQETPEGLRVFEMFVPEPDIF